MNPHVPSIAAELALRPVQVEAAMRLLEEGATIPFIARYRKEATGSLDEVALAAIRDRRQQLLDLDKRRDAIKKSLVERELLDPELGRRIDAARTMVELEDVYLPFRPKRRTRAMIARERGLEPLAQSLWRQDGARIDADAFIDPAKGVPDREAALAGARDVIAEWISEDADARAELRAGFLGHALLTSKAAKGKKDDAAAARFRDWFDWSEPIAEAPSHRILAILRGQREGVLSVSARPDEGSAIARLERRVLRGGGFAREQVRTALVDAYQRLIAPSLENETLKAAKERADAEAIRVFADNVRELLLAAPLGRKRVLAIDPGLRTGCKVVALDAQGELLEYVTIFPHQGPGQRDQAKATIARAVQSHRIEAIAVGNGTAGRETEAFVREIGLDVPIVMVDESGASIYSASEIAREEFPNHDVTVRGSVSIGRRLQDPLAELVKLDPRSLGVGQYQHDVDSGELERSLDDVVQSCVNAVGVEVNSASPKLLTYVAGLGPQLARNIVQHRAANGPFATRADLLKVPRLGSRAFEQCAGFLRIRGGRHPLDDSGVHPERYALVARMANDLDHGIEDLKQDASLRARLPLDRYVGDGVGEPTLHDILAELARPGRDPRPTFEAFSFADVREITDLQPGMRIPGVVTNVTQFGAFVDVGVHQDGLVHVSQLADRFVRDPAEVVKVRQRVTVTVLDVDLERKRIALSMKSNPDVERGRSGAS